MIALDAYREAMNVGREAAEATLTTITMERGRAQAAGRGLGPSDQEEAIRVTRSVLDALLAPSRTPCETCESSGRVRGPADAEIARSGWRHSRSYKCPDCTDGMVEGPPVIHRLLGLEQVGWGAPGVQGSYHLTSHQRWRDSEPVYRLSDTRGSE